MGIEKAILWSISMVLSLFIVVTCIDYFVILHTKIDFDMLSRQYYWICEQNVGLTIDEKTELETKLSDKGYENIEVLAPIRGTVSRGETITFSIKSTMNFNQRKTLFESTKEEVNLSYLRESISRRVTN